MTFSVSIFFLVSGIAWTITAYLQQKWKRRIYLNIDNFYCSKALETALLTTHQRADPSTRGMTHHYLPNVGNILIFVPFIRASRLPVSACARMCLFECVEQRPETDDILWRFPSTSLDTIAFALTFYVSLLLPVGAVVCLLTLQLWNESELCLSWEQVVKCDTNPTSRPLCRQICCFYTAPASAELKLKAQTHSWSCS